MHPALSVIFFTTLAGAGLGLFALLGVTHAVRGMPDSREAALLQLAVAGGLLATGLLSSTLHLGRPLRAWRAFSQWRSSWLSREGVVSLATFAAAIVTAVLLWHGDAAVAFRVAAALLALLAALATLCTARIYDTLTAIPAWHDSLVLPNYATIGVITGAAWFWLLAAVGGQHPSSRTAAIFAAFVAAAFVIKLAYWRRIDRKALPTDLGSLTGLGRFGTVRAFEAPHTETNYLLREMGYVLARRHAARLRVIALLLLFGAPLAASLAVAAGAAGGWVLAAAVLIATLPGGFVERWLFFAEAKHVVTLYYPATQPR